MSEQYEAFIVLRRSGTLWKSIHRGETGGDPIENAAWVPFVLVGPDDYGENLTEQEVLTDIVHRAYGMQDRGRPLAEYAPVNHLIVPLGDGVARILECVPPEPREPTWKVRRMEGQDDVLALAVRP